jgi:hypothetical protein
MTGADRTTLVLGQNPPGMAEARPTRMRAVLLTGHGGYEKLVHRNDVPVPDPRATLSRFFDPLGDACLPVGAGPRRAPFTADELSLRSR